MTTAVAYSYIRFSTPKQLTGDSLRRQTEAAASWCKRTSTQLDTSHTYHDLGKSAYLGDHRNNPDRHALAAFLKLVSNGKIPRGSFLIIEALDRLTREHVQAGLRLCLALLEAGIRIVQLSPSEIIYDEKSDAMSLMLMVVELARGHGESKRKSDLSGPAWRRKKDGARNGEIVTDRLPFWVRIEDGKLALIPEHAETVKEIFRLASTGYGAARIVSKFTKEGVKAIGKTGKWGKAYIQNILRDRRAIGEYQPRKGKERVPDGDPVPSYFPAVVTEEDYFAARAGAAERGQLRGRSGTGQVKVNLFTGLIKNARDGDAYYMTTRTQGARESRWSYHVLINVNAEQGRSPCFAFPYVPFERAVLDRLKEIDPGDIVGPNGHAKEITALSGELADVEARIAALELELINGDVPSLARVLRGQEDKKRDLTTRLAEARTKAAHPMAESWGEARSLLDTLDSAPDPDDARLRLRSALRRIVSEMWLLVAPIMAKRKEKIPGRKGGRKRIHPVREIGPSPVRLAALQMFFKSGARRDYVIYHKRAVSGFHGTTPEDCHPISEIDIPFGDLRDRKQAADLASILETWTPPVE